ncbi:inositol 1,4,5-triphosphate receptor associated 2 [Nematostella vectensis]|uniref:inositol 1,4,5-triphosphate receptor associated 2 n=1 Tax=Nematostella vectensis TaxID=45351 RepID=UPI0020775495|nr:inositol 1,4,5-triphosphate receptor associated 2 [Nematostella vectensis]
MSLSESEDHDSSAEEHELSKLKEEAILDSLFYACEVDDSGKVPVSRLISYLRTAVAKDSNDNTPEFADNLDDLSLILDPEGQDVHISLTTYHAGISEWIDEIRKRSMASLEEQYYSPVTVNCTSPSFGSLVQNGLDLATSTPNASTDSVEGIGGESPKKNDWDRAQEMMATIESLQANNKRLLDQYSSVQAQMDLTDELNAQLTAELTDLKKQMQILQHTSEKYKLLEKENADLRQSVSETQEVANSLQNRNSLLEREKQSLEENIQDLNVKLTQSQSEISLLASQKKELTESIGLQKQVVFEELKNVREEFAEESTTKTQYLNSVIAELTLANEELKLEKSRLEQVVADLTDEHPRDKPHDSSCSPSSMPYSASTPVQRKRRPFSLKQELQAQLSTESRDLPSPLVGNSMCCDSLDGTALDTMGGSVFDHSWASYASHDTNTSIEGYSIVATQVATEFREKKDKALQQINELACLDTSPGVKVRHEVIANQFNEEMNTFAEKINSICLKKKSAEKRSAKLLITVKKLKEECERLQIERDKAYQKLGNLSLSSDDIDTRMEDLKKELSKVKEQLKASETTIEDLQNQLATINTELAAVRDEREKLAKTLGIQNEHKDELERKLIDAHRSQSQLDIQQTHQILRIKELEEELKRLSNHLLTEKERTTALEESLHLSVTKHSNEMQEIMDMIPITESELNKAKQSPRSSSPRVTGHTLRSRLQDYILAVQGLLPPESAVRASPDGKPRSDLDDSSAEGSTHPPSLRATKGLPSPPYSSVSSQSPERSAQSPYYSAESGVYRTVHETGSQTDLTSEYMKALESISGREKAAGDSNESDAPRHPKMLSLWKKKLAVSFKHDEDYPDSLDSSANSGNFVDGVSLHVRPAPSEREVEKHFRALVLAFQTDQMTLEKRLRVQERNRAVAESNMDQEFQHMTDLLKRYEEKYVRTKELQNVVVTLLTQIEVLRSSCQRVSSLAQQHGSVQQESRMSGGLEVMICHAENVSRHLERASQDLNEFRKKESLLPDDSDSNVSAPTQNGPTRIGGYGREKSASVDETGSADESKQNSLAHFMMAIHNTSVRAKQVLHSFRRRTIDTGTLWRSQETDSDEGDGEALNQDPCREREGSISSSAGSSEGERVEETEAVSQPVEPTPRPVHMRGACGRLFLATLRIIFTTLFLIFLLLGTLVFCNTYTSYKLRRDHIPEWIIEVLDPLMDRYPGTPNH